MTVSKETSVDFQEKFNKVLKLIYEDSKYDPVNQPYVSKYSANQILLGLKASLESLLKTIDAAQKLKLTSMLGSVLLYLGIISIETEELSVGATYLERLEDLIRDVMDIPEIVMITLNMYNQLGILWSQREPEKSKQYLEKAEKLYHEYETKSLPPVDICDLFLPNVEEINIDMGRKNFEKAHTLTLYYLAQIYGQLKDTLKSSIYCHVTLQRQLESKDYDPVDWALNAATLSQFFMEQNGFKQARHHLSASSFILEQYQEELNKITDRNETFDAKMEVFKHRSADVARCWAKYGLLLLAKSKERLMNHTEDIDAVCSMSSDLSSITLDPESTVTSSDLENLEFTSLNLTKYESQITYKFILTMQDARLVFLNIQTWLEKAQSYYTLDSLASDYIEIVQDQSQMYQNLLFFEDNPETQAKLHKRRIDLFESLISKTNPQYYLIYCRQIWYDLGQTYSDILNIKSDKLREQKERPTPHALTKINYLIDKSITNFNYFIESFKKLGAKEFPNKISDDYEKAFLQAYFHVGAMYSKYISLEKIPQIVNTEASLDAYQKVIDYCKANPKAKELIPMEFNICEQMVGLLPVKISKLQRELV